MASIPVIALESSKPNVNRRSANYHPTVWGDYFLTRATDFQVAKDDSRAHLKLKGEVRLMLTSNEEYNSIEKLVLIDSIQRLGVAYHFENEIDEILTNINSRHYGHGDSNVDLYAVSLTFRLLRQQGHNINSDIFKKFKNSQGKFKESLNKDPRGLLSLYEASHLRIHEEDILDEALDFTTAQLRSITANSVGHPLAAQINHALKQPIRTGLPRLEARRYFPIYQHKSSRNDVLFAFAKMDFNILQKMHQKELSIISKWWKELDLPRKLPYIRDRIVECFFWITGAYFEPEYAMGRGILTRVIAMASILDDTYDSKGTPDELELFTAAVESVEIVECFFWITGAYFEPEYAMGRGILTRVIAMVSILDDTYDSKGTPDELELFNAAVERWDMSAADKLPEYMKVIYSALLDIYKTTEDEMTREGKLYCFRHAREAMINQARFYYEESKWIGRQEIPMEEYMPVVLKTSGYHLLATTSFVGMGKHATKESFEWLNGYPKILKASELVCRLMDDIVSSKFEKEREHIISSIECYMKQYGATEEEAIREFNRQIKDAWKDINEACLYPTAVPMPLLTRILNFTRVINVLYKNEDGYTNSTAYTKDMVSSLLVDPVEDN